MGRRRSNNGVGWRFALPVLHMVVLVAAQIPADPSKTRVFQHKGWLPPVTKCPETCETLFSKLEDDPNNEGKRYQFIEMQQRGEPQSGLSFMFGWASDYLGQSCIFLQRAYGRESCRVEWTDHNRAMIFEPWRGTGEDKKPQCSCDNVSSVIVRLSSDHKHDLPCDGSCGWSRRGGIAPRPKEPVCIPREGKPTPEDHAGLVTCMNQAACPTTDERLQMAVLRDPRAMTASRFFHIQREHPEWLERSQLTAIDDFYLAALPNICMWTSVRYRVFAQILATRTTVYYYDDALYSPLAWHYNLLWYLGLSMPPAVIEWAAHTASIGGPGFGFSDGDGRPREDSLRANNRTYKDEVSPETLHAGDDILRTWLPQVLLEKFGVPETA